MCYNKKLAAKAAFDRPIDKKEDKAMRKSEEAHLLSETRAKAIELGAVHYDTKKKCQNGHLAKRRTLSGKCVMCEANKQKRNLSRRDPEDLKKRRREYEKRKRIEIREAREKVKKQTETQK